MRTIKPLAIALVAAASLSFAAAPNDWKIFRPAQMHFSVSMPGTPTAASHTQSDPVAGSFTFHTYQLTANGVRYMVQEVEFAKALDNGTPQVMLAGVVNGFQGTSGATLISDKEATFQGYAARTMMFKKDAKRLRGLTLNVHNHNLLFVAGADASEINSPKITKFFNSIKALGG